MIAFVLSVVGGPYDGVRFGLVGTEAELPEVMLVGRCTGAGECDMRPCGKPHAAYWEPGEAPVPTVRYELDADSIEVDGSDGEARYVMGGVGGRGRLEESELVPVGAGEGICYG